MRSLTVRLPEPLAADIDKESRRRRVSKSDVVRERLERARNADTRSTPAFDAIADLVGSVGGLPRDTSARKKHYLRSLGYGRKNPR